MINSMTSFGRSKYTVCEREYLVEIKSVNHKYSDISIKMNKNISYLEDIVRKTALKYISRGKVEIFISLTNNSEIGKEIMLNIELAKKYIQELNKLVEQNKIINDISVMEIARLPDVINFRNEQDEELIQKELLICLEDALKNLIHMRQIEGKQISEDLILRLKKIQAKVEQISKLSTGLIEEYIVKLKNRIQELLSTDIIDQNRLAQEVVIYTDKSSVEEEITRLKSHINQSIELLGNGNCIGKRLDFLAQEMNREANTIASKANCLNIVDLVIDIKTEIENVREQIQNIE